jgi:hypothetical protein
VGPVSPKPRGIASEKVTGALRSLELQWREAIVLIDAGRDNKTPGSKT